MTMQQLAGRAFTGGLPEALDADAISKGPHVNTLKKRRLEYDSQSRDEEWNSPEEIFKWEFCTLVDTLQFATEEWLSQLERGNMGIWVQH